MADIFLMEISENRRPNLYNDMKVRRKSNAKVFWGAFYMKGANPVPVVIGYYKNKKEAEQACHDYALERLHSKTVNIEVF